MTNVQDAHNLEQQLLENKNMLLAEHINHQTTELTDILNDHDTDPHSFTLKPSPYYSLDNFSQMLKAHKIKDKFSILSWNCNSLPDKHSYLQSLLETMHHLDKTFSFDALLIQETKLTKNIEGTINFKNYTQKGTRHISRNQGGIAIYIKNSLEFEELTHIPQPTLNKSFQWIFGKVYHKSNPNNFKIIGNVYRSPGTDFELFIQEFSQVLEKLKHYKNETYIAGDFNLDLLEINSDDKVQNFFNTFMSHSFIPTATMPTRFPPPNIKNSKQIKTSLLDNIYVKMNHYESNTPGILSTKQSDHFPVFVLGNKIKQKEPRNKTVTYRNFSHINVQTFKNELEKIDWTQVTLQPDANSAYNLFHNVYQIIYDRNFPEITSKFNKYTHKTNPWVTKGIMKSILFRDNLHAFLRSIKDENLKEETSKYYKRYNNTLTYVIRKSKSLHYTNLLEKTKGDMKSTWKTLNSLIGRCKKNVNLVEAFLINNKLSTDKKEIANNFNAYFTAVGSKLAEKIPPSKHSHMHYLSKVKIETPDLIFEPTNIEEVIRISKKINTKFSTDYYNISTAIALKSLPSIAHILTHIFNQSISQGLFPDRLKTAKITPVHKKEEKNIFSNYRPISNLPVFSKILERIISDKITKHLQSNKLLAASQYGFRNNHSTDHAIVELIDRVTDKMDSKLWTSGIFLDLSKAFDTLDHKILIDKLDYYGIKNNSLKLLSNYLQNRLQCTNFNNTISTLLPISHGIPQGSILGPLLFILYINDISETSKIFSFILFADDTNLLASGYDQNLLLSEINKDLNIIGDWLKANKLSLNIKKTEDMLFTTYQRKRYRNQNLINEITLQEGHIKPVTQTQFLGTTITECLSWKPFFEQQALKANKALGILYCLKKILPQKALLQIYYSILLPHLQYGILAWGSYLNGSLRLEIIQKQAVRVITNSRYNAHTSHLFSNLGLLKLEDIYKMQVSLFIHKFKNNNLPKYFEDFINPTKISADFNTNQLVGSRNDHTYSFPKFDLFRPSNERLNTLRFNCYYIWEKLPTTLINFIGTNFTFKKQIKKHFLETYPKEKNCHIINCFSCRL